MGLMSVYGSLLDYVLQQEQAKKQQKNNLGLAAFQGEMNQELLQQQLRYNDPASQMRRYKAAGLNPHLIYGQGSPGNQQAPLSYPDVRPADFQRPRLDLSQLLPVINQSRLVESQVSANNAATRQRYSVASLNDLQAQVIARNPLLDDGAYRAIIDGLISTATIKGEQSKQESIKTFVSESSAGLIVSKLFHEVQVLEQRFKLGQADQKIKAEILKSQEFKNAILEVQKKFMTDAEITPQHILQFVQLLLMKIL